MDSATTSFQTALRIDPDLASAHASLGLILSNQGKKSEAATHFRKALSLYEKNGEGDTEIAKSVKQALQSN
jgi:Tfp pilus assembly protein PilF